MPLKRGCVKLYLHLNRTFTPPLTGWTHPHSCAVAFSRRRSSCCDQRYDARMEPRAKLWVEEDGKLVLSDYRVRLLALIEETGSLADAAERMHLSYRRAWGKVREIEQNLGIKLVESAAGGAGGGGSSLTDAGRRLVQLYERFRAAVDTDVMRAFEREFGRERKPTRS